MNFAPSRPDQPGKSGDQNKHNDGIGFVEEPAKLRVAVPARPEPVADISEPETPRPRAEKCIDLEFCHRHPRQSGGKSDEGSHHRQQPADKNRSGAGYTDRWIVYGTVDGAQLFSAKELTIEPGIRCKLQDPGASGWITVQGRGKMGRLNLQTPAMIHFGEETEDEVFITHEAAATGVEIENTGSEPLVGLRYFGPDVHSNLPKVGEYQ